MQAAITRNTDDELVIYSSASGAKLLYAAFIAAGGLIVGLTLRFVRHGAQVDVGRTLFLIGFGSVFLIIGALGMRRTRDTTYRFQGRQSQLQVSSAAGDRTIGFADLARAELEEHNDADGGTCFGVQLVLRGSNETLSLIRVETGWGRQDKEALAGQINAFLDRWCPLPAGPRATSVVGQMKNVIGQILSASGSRASESGRAKEIIGQLSPPPGASASDVRRIKDIIDKSHAPQSSAPAKPTPPGSPASELGQIKEIVGQLPLPPGASTSDVRRIKDIMSKLDAAQSSPPVTPTPGFSARLHRAVAGWFLKRLIK